MTNLSETARKNKRAYDNAYARQNFASKNIAFNKRYPEDLALLEWVQQQPNGNQYIKQLIREDMERQKAKAQENK